jgi:hypothetical protein
MQKHSKCIIFLICLQFSIINILYAKFIANTILKPKQVICLEKLSFGVYILAMFPPGNMAESLIYQLLPLMLFANRALEERPTHGVCSLQYIANAPLINNPARKLCAIKRSSHYNVTTKRLIAM